MRIGFKMMLALPLAAASAATPDYDGVWFDPVRPGDGVTIDQQGDIVAAVWYTHDASGYPAWYTFSGVPQGDPLLGAASFDASIHETQHDGDLDGPPPRDRIVGVARLVFRPLGAIALRWRFDDGRSGEYALQRLALAPTEPISGRYAGHWEQEWCPIGDGPHAAVVEVLALDGRIQIAENLSSPELFDLTSTPENPDICVYRGRYRPRADSYAIEGEVTCLHAGRPGVTRSWDETLVLAEGALLRQYSIGPLSGGACPDRFVFRGARR